MSLGTADHRHCKVCGKVTRGTDEFCSKKCREQREELQRNRRNLTYLFYIGIVVIILITVVELTR